MIGKNKNISVTFILVTIAALILSGCGGGATPAPTQDPAVIYTQAAQTVVADMTLNAPVATQPPPPTAGATQLPPPPGPTPDPNIPVAVFPTPAPGEPGAIANYNTTIYSGPGENYVVYAAFLGGKTAKVVGKSEDGLWWAISVPVAPNGTGWVDSGWVTVLNTENVPVLPTPPVPETVELVSPGPDDPQAVALANVYVRTGPAANFPAYGIAPGGTSGRVIGKSEDSQWWVMRLNPERVGAGYGWVEAEFTQAQNVEQVQTITTPPAAQPVPPAPPAAGVPAAIAIDYVNVRNGPGTNYTVLGVAATGASAEVSGKSEDGQWWQVKIPTLYSADGFGWVSASYVITQDTDSVPVVAAPTPPQTVNPTPPAGGPTGCSLVGQTPADGTVYGPGTPFDTTWVLGNTTAASWDQNATDLMYVGATGNMAFHQGPDLYDLATTVEPGWTYNFTVPMIAPYDPGVYGELWQIMNSSQVVCQFYVYIEVK